MISSDKTAITLIGNGLNKQFDFDFFVLKNSAGAPLLKVFYRGDSGDTQEITTNMSIALNPDQDSTPGGSITYPVNGDPIPAGAKFIIMRAGEFKQKKNFERYQGFDPGQIEEALDIGTTERQELREQMTRALSAPVGQTPEEYFADTFGIIEDTKEAAAAAQASAAAAQEAAGEALSKTATAQDTADEALSKATSNEAKLVDASPTVRGLAYTASGQDINDGIPEKLVDAEQLKQQFTEKVQQAGTSTAGINTLTTHNQAINGLGKGNVTSDLIPGIMAAYIGGGGGDANHVITYGHTVEGFPYELLEMDDDVTRVVKIWGNATVTAGNWVDITLPGELINPAYLGISGIVTGGTSAGEVRWHKTGTTNTNISIGVRSGTNWVAGELSFMIMAQLDSPLTPPAPHGIYVRSIASGAIEFSTSPFNVLPITVYLSGDSATTDRITVPAGYTSCAYEIMYRSELSSATEYISLYLDNTLKIEVQGDDYGVDKFETGSFAITAGQMVRCDAYVQSGYEQAYAKVTLT